VVLAEVAQIRAERGIAAAMIGEIGGAHVLLLAEQGRWRAIRADLDVFAQYPDVVRPLVIFGDPVHPFDVLARPQHWLHR
jgi:hypothetical protein